MKKVTLYQAAKQEVFMQNMLGNYASIEAMEAVVMLRKEGKDKDILEEIFRLMNDVKYKYSLLYSMSKGDIVTIDDNAYRCLPEGWQLI